MRACILTLALVLACCLGTAAAAQTPEPVTPDMLARWIDELSNWGRWGKDDEKGTLNLITEETRRAAARLVRDGVSVSMAHDALEAAGAWNPNPYQHMMVRPGAGGTAPFAVDSIAVTFHGPAHSHLDALCHRFHEGRMYNGFSRQEVGPEGCARNGVAAASDGIFTRGVLVDLPRSKGVRWLEPGSAIYPADLEAWEKQTGVRIGAGDAVLVRTGRWLRWDEEGPWVIGERSAGLHASCAAWLRARDVAVLGSDVGADVRPSGLESESHPLHLLALYAMGMPILDQLDLEEVAVEAARRGRWEFLLTAAPIRIQGGTGSPLNPIATF